MRGSDGRPRKVASLRFAGKKYHVNPIPPLRVSDVFQLQSATWRILVSFSESCIISIMHCDLRWIIIEYNDGSQVDLEELRILHRNVQNELNQFRPTVTLILRKVIATSILDRDAASTSSSSLIGDRNRICSSRQKKVQ